MRLLEYMDKPALMEEYWQTIKKKCKPFLKEWLPIVKPHKNKPAPMWPYIYRGILNNPPEFGEKPVRKDRAAQATPQDFSDRIDDAMYKKFKIRGRSQSIFCTGDAYEAHKYGTECMIFPVGSYKYLWSPEVQDLYYEIIPRYTMSPKVYAATYAKKRGIDVNDDKAFKQFLQQSEEKLDGVISYYVGTYKTDNLKNAIQSQNEIMIQCKSYIFVSYTARKELTDMINKEL